MGMGECRVRASCGGGVETRRGGCYLGGFGRGVVS